MTSFVIVKAIYDLYIYVSSLSFFSTLKAPKVTYTFQKKINAIPADGNHLLVLENGWVDHNKKAVRSLERSTL